jgi:prephenate dehydrogenase
MWRDILLANRLELVEQSKIFQRSLMNMLKLAEDGNGEKLEEMIDQASQARAHWRMGSKNK